MTTTMGRRHSNRSLKRKGSKKSATSPRRIKKRPSPRHPRKSVASHKYRAGAVVPAPPLKYDDAITIKARPRGNSRPLYSIVLEGGTLDVREKLARHILSQLRDRGDEVKLNDGCEVRPGMLSNHNTEIIKVHNDLYDGPVNNSLTNHHTSVSIAPILKEIVEGAEGDIFKANLF